MYSIRLEGDTRQLLRRTQHLADVDKKEINEVLAETVRESTQERFRTQKSPEERQWKPSKRVREIGGVTLTNTARLKNSIHSFASSSGFAVGTNVIYASTHQLGARNRKITIRAKTSRGLIFRIGSQWIRKQQVQVKVNIPARPFLGLSDEDNDEIRHILEEYFEDEQS